MLNIIDGKIQWLKSEESGEFLGKLHFLRKKRRFNTGF